MNISELPAHLVCAGVALAFTHQEVNFQKVLPGAKKYYRSDLGNNLDILVKVRSPGVGVRFWTPVVAGNFEKSRLWSGCMDRTVDFFDKRHIV